VSGSLNKEDLSRDGRVVLLFDNSELKRRLKADKKAKEKAEKSAAAAAAAATTATVTSESMLSGKESEDIDPNVSCPTSYSVSRYCNCFSPFRS